MMMSKFRDKTALALGSAAAVTIAPVAEAALVTVSNSPVSVSFWPTVEVSPLWHNQTVWDVDGVNGPDFALLAQGGKGGTSQNYTLGGGIALNVHSETNPSFVRAPVNSFEFHSCERTSQVEYLTR